MIIHTLVQRYEDKPSAPEGWQPREVSYALDIDVEGRLLDVLLLEREEPKVVGGKTIKKTTKPMFILPSVGSGRSGKKAYETTYFLCDDGSYMLGLDPLKFESAAKLYAALLADVDTPAAKAMLSYFRAGIPAFPDTKLNEKTAVTAKFIFQYNGRFVHEDAEIRRTWDNYSSRGGGEQKSGGDFIRCAITGEQDTVARLHDKVELMGVTMSKQPLISMNDQTSFRSYGSKPSDPPAQIGGKTAFAYVSALNDLLKSKGNHIFIGNDTLAFWAEKGGEAEEEAFSWFVNPKQDDEAALKDVMDRISDGAMVHIDRFNPTRRFYLLCLSPNAARIAVRFFHSDSFGGVAENIARHYRRMEIIGDNRTPFEMIPMWVILSETTVKQSAGDAAPLLGGQLLRAVITGGDYPMTLYHAMLARIRAGGSVNKTKAAVMKAVLIKNYHESEVTTMALNEQSDNKPYVLGRLFAALEKLQKDAAGGGLNATIRDRYFASACANPGSVLPTLLRLSMHHAAKLDHSVFFERLKGELLGKLDAENPFPAALSMDDQGRFILGYYHQTQAFYTKKDKEGDTSNA